MSWRPSPRATPRRTASLLPTEPPGAPFSPALALRHRIGRPDLFCRFIAAARTAVPEARPQDALGIRPDAARSDAPARRLDDGRRAGLPIDLRDVIAGERGVPDVAARRRC